MKPETKVKIKMKAVKAWRKVKEAAPTVLSFGGCVLIGVGAGKGYRNSREIRTLKANDHELAKAYNEMSERQQQDRDRMLELERQQNLLFERALKETEGKAE